MITGLFERAVYSTQLKQVLSSLEAFLWFFNESPYARLAEKPGISDFALGNPHEMPLAQFSQALQTWSSPQNQNWFAYKMSEPGSREIISQSLQKRLGIPFSAENIHMTNGAFGAISVALKTIIDPGDEILYISPPWFFYKPMIVSHYGEAVRIACDPSTLLPDLNSIERAITPRTRGIIINSPNNPTGKIYPPAFLKDLAQLLSAASMRIHNPIYLLSDEAYSRILFSGQRFHSPAEYYANSFVLYTYGKTLLAPGERIGYIALPDAMPQRQQLSPAILAAQMTSGYAFPNAVLQHALADLETLSIDISQLERRRDRLIPALQAIGYEVYIPEGTFYLLVRSPIPDDQAFINLLGEENILCLPGTTFEMPGYFRISLTANDTMVENALPGFARVFNQVKSSPG